MTSLAQEPENSRLLSPQEAILADRYSRQILFPGIRETGQRKLSAAKVGIVGCGATGSALAALLARAGVGTLRVIDRDYVEASNLQRQSLFDESDAAESLPKAIAAARKIAAFNSQIVAEPKVEDLVPGNVEALLQGLDLILDGTDNFEARYLTSHASLVGYVDYDVSFKSLNVASVLGTVQLPGRWRPAPRRYLRRRR